MIVVFASAFDPTARTLLARWKDHDASLLTCDDLSIAGWRHYLGPGTASTCVVQRRVVPAGRIAGVLIRWPGVFPQELTQIAAADREYVAGEMTAFLVSWLSTLECPVVNRPTPLNLSGPAWRQEQWTHVAAQLGIPVRPVRRQLTSSSYEQVRDQLPSDTTTVTVVGERCFGPDEPALRDHARRLAQAAGVLLLDVVFSGPHFLAAQLIPHMTDQVGDAVLDLLLGRSVAASLRRE